MERDKGGRWTEVIAGNEGRGMWEDQVYQSIKPQTLQSIKQTSRRLFASIHSDGASEAARDKDRLSAVCRMSWR